MIKFIVNETSNNIINFTFPVMLKIIQISSPAKGGFFVDCTSEEEIIQNYQFPKTKVE